MAITRRTEPWSALLEAGRSDDRLVREAYEGARAPVFRGRFRPICIRGWCRAWPTPVSTSSTSTNRRRWAPPGARRRRHHGDGAGKSLCFNLPTLDPCSRAKARALYLYPTKALAQDQARALHALRAAKRVRPRSTTATRPRGAPAPSAGGRTGAHQPRHAARRDPAQPRAWADFFANLAVVVSTRRTSTAACSARTGQRAAPAAARRRRLRQRAARRARRATIANPVELAVRLTGFEDVALRRRGRVARRGERQIAMWNPPVVDEALQLACAAR